MTDATFVITTPYPNQAQIQALSPVLAGWTGNIGTGAPQTGYGYGDLDLANSTRTGFAFCFLRLQDRIADGGHHIRGHTHGLDTLILCCM
jgi:hypothetical protein